MGSSLDYRKQFSDMDSLLERNNKSGLLDMDYSTKRVYFPSVMYFLVTVLSLPGNVCVIAVYIRQMTIPVKVYMFALAMADTGICICGIVLSSIKIDRVTAGIVFFISDVTITFSICMLAFVSIERLVAVCWRHSVNLSAVRVKLSLCVITLASSCNAIVLFLARLQRNVLLGRSLRLFNIISGVVIVTVCYVVIAVKLVRYTRAIRTNVAVLSLAETTATASSTVPSNIRTSTPKNAKTYKSVLLMFLVTVVFNVCWLPQWLMMVGVVVSDKLRFIFLVNSGVNPFIYSAVSSRFRSDVRQFCNTIKSKLTACF